jgi:hypothetical protein
MTRPRPSSPTPTVDGTAPATASPADGWTLVAAGVFTGLGGILLSGQAIQWAGPYFFNDGLDPRDPTYHLQFPTGSLALLALGVVLVVAGAVLVLAGRPALPAPFGPTGTTSPAARPRVWVWVLAVVAPAVVFVVDGFLLLLATLGGL